MIILISVWCYSFTKYFYFNYIYKQHQWTTVYVFKMSILVIGVMFLLQLCFQCVLFNHSDEGYILCRNLTMHFKSCYTIHVFSLNNTVVQFISRIYTKSSLTPDLKRIIQSNQVMKTYNNMTSHVGERYSINMAS